MIAEEQKLKGTLSGEQSLAGSMKDIPSLDKTLTKEGYAADSKAVGDALATKANEIHQHKKEDITDFPTSLPASDVYAWAKQPQKPSYTASEVKARPDNWMPSATDVGALPVANSVFNSDTNFDEIQANIIAWVNPWEGNKTGVHVPPTGGFIHSFHYSGQEFQRFYGMNGELLQRIKGGEWEWENPPMALGVEYRTTERWQGKAVYTIAFGTGQLPNNSVLSLTDCYTATNIIRASGATNNGSRMSFPTTWHEWDSASSTMITKEVGLMVASWGASVFTNYDASSVNATIQIWYTKD